MAGYIICSLDAQVFEQLTTAPTIVQCLVLADHALDGLEVAVSEYSGDESTDTYKWPADRDALANSIQKRLASTDWYADLTHGDAVIWDHVLRGLQGNAGEELAINFQNENDGMLYWDAADTAAELGAPMMAEPKFGSSGFRYSGRSRTRLELNYTIYLPAEVQQLLGQLEQAAPHFEGSDENDDEPESEFFEGLLEPVRKIAEEGRVMWVQTDT